MKAPWCQWGADGEGGELLRPGLRGVGGWEGRREGWGSLVESASGGGGEAPPPSCHPHPEEHRFSSPIQGTRRWAGSKATVSSGPLGFFLLFQGPYFSVVPFLPPQQVPPGPSSPSPLPCSPFSSHLTSHYWEVSNRDSAQSSVEAGNALHNK